MPSHKTHDTITYLLLIFLIPISLLYIGINIYSLIFIISYIFAGLMFNGDLIVKVNLIIDGRFLD